MEASYLNLPAQGSRSGIVLVSRSRHYYMGGGQATLVPGGSVVGGGSFSIGR